MISKTQTLTEFAPIVADFEGAITSCLNIRPDEVLLKDFGGQPVITVIFSSGKRLDLPLHMDVEEYSLGRLIIPEKCFKEASNDREIQDFLLGLFDNQRFIDVEVLDDERSIFIEPVNIKKYKFSMAFMY